MNVPTEQDQTKLLEEATKKVKEQAFYMKRAMDTDDLKLTLSHASDMLRELRTSLLKPANYYELYIKVCDELRYLEEFFMALHRQGHSMELLYEQVQSCGNVLPRLYLLVTAGAAYIASKETPARACLQDLAEMAKGVQHPMRGLFLRHYLAHQTRDKLPDEGSPYAENGGGSLGDAYEFVLKNFTESNRLWVRMQHQGSSKERKAREKERLDLRILVGTNLVRLSQLEGVTSTLYASTLLPAVLEQVVSCKDPLAQTYLMDCIIQVFPDEFHLATLQQFLDTCLQLKEKSTARGVLESMMERLALFAVEHPEAKSEADNAYPLFSTCVARLVASDSNPENGPPLSKADCLLLQASLLGFALRWHPERTELAGEVVVSTAEILTPPQGTSCRDEALPQEAVDALLRVLSLPLDKLALQVLQLPRYADCMSALPWQPQKMLACDLLRAALAANAGLNSVEEVEQLFVLAEPLLRDQHTSGEQENSQIVEEEQLLVARLVHLMKHDNTDTLFAIYMCARKHFGQGGVKRIQYTLVPLVFGALRLVRLVKTEEQQAQADGAESKKQYSSRKVFQFLHEVVTAMAPPYPNLALALFLQCALSADWAGFKAIAYEFISQGFVVYEDELSDSKAQVRALSSMAGALLACRGFDAEDYDALATKTTQYAAKLLKKPDQCKMVTVCSSLFWAGKAEEVGHYHDGRRVLECLQRALKIADVCMASSMNVQLFIQILNQYVYFFDNNNPEIADKHLTGLIALINEHIESMDQSEARKEVEVQFRNILRHIQLKQASSDTAARYASIEIVGVH